VYVKSKFAAFFAALLMGLMLVTPAQASAAQAAAHIVALGDSYGAGTGAGDYEPGTEDTCWRSAHSVAEEVVGQLTAEGFPVDFDNVACAGATIDDLRRPYHGVVQLNALRRDTLLVFLTIGGNDIGFGDVVSQCLAPNASCTNGAIEGARSKLLGMGKNLHKLLKQIKARSPQAKIVLLGYGQPMTAGPNAAGVPNEYLDPICAPQYFDQNERREGARLSADLDLTLRLTVVAAQYTDGVEATFISPYDYSRVGGLDSRFAGHSLCEAPVPQQFYRGFDVFAPPPVGDAAGQSAVLHMNRAGYELLAELVITEAPSGYALN
jgi:lysophospholipase L1-like esterase